MKRSYSDKIFDIVNISIMIVLLIVFVWPLWFVFIASISEPNAVLRGEVLLLPKQINFKGYERILSYQMILKGYANSVFYTVVGTILNMVMSILLAYPLSYRSFGPRKFFNWFFIATMYFSGGLIPMYLLVRGLGILDTRWAILIPGMVSVYNALIIKNFFMNSIPQELQEAATLDGANAAQYLWRVVLPLSKPVFAVVGLYYMVGNWNNYTKALYYIYNEDLYPLQSVLRQLLISSKLVHDLAMDAEEMAEAIEQAQLMQYGVIIVAALPMLCVYPFVQKYFVKGAMLGALKG